VEVEVGRKFGRRTMQRYRKRKNGGKEEL
jgi:hypothetical protein